MSAAAQSVAGTEMETKPSLKIWQYEIPAKARNEGFKVKMPAGAVITSVQRGELSAVIFAMVNPEMPEEERLFYVAGTNFSLPSPEPEYKALHPVGSWLGFGKWWHLFEVETWREAGVEG
jgi:hypothetical protein